MLRALLDLKKNAWKATRDPIRGPTSTYYLRPTRLRAGLRVHPSNRLANPISVTNMIGDDTPHYAHHPIHLPSHPFYHPSITTDLYVPILSLTWPDQYAPHIYLRDLSSYSRAHMLYDPFSLLASSHHRSQAFSASSFFNIITMELTNPIEGMQIFSPFNPIAFLTDRSPQNKVLLTLPCPKKPLCRKRYGFCVWDLTKLQHSDQSPPI